MRGVKHHRGHAFREPELVAQADALDEENRQVDRAKAESLVVEEENQRVLNPGISQSLDDFPALLSAEEQGTSGQLTNQGPSALDQTSTRDTTRDNGQDYVEDLSLDDPPPGDEEGEEDGTARSVVGEVYKDLKAGDEDDAW